MQIFGELTDDKIIVKKTRDVGRLYNKSNFGKTITGNKLQLNLLEGIFLLGEEKIKIFKNNKEVDFQSLVKLAAERIPRFEIKYLIFRDLRKRGHAVKISEEGKEFDFCIFKQKDGGENKSCFISIYSERDIVNIDEIKHLIEMAAKANYDLWFAIADEEGDLTYYDVALMDARGKTGGHIFSKSTGILLENRVIVFDKKLGDSLLEKEFFGKPFGNGLQLSLAEALYLLEKDVIEIEDIDGKKLSLNKFKTFIQQSQPDIESRIVVFKDLKKRGLIVKTGFKFGAHFRAYTRNPNETHAEYLIHVVNKGFRSAWAEISRAVRLAHSVNKEILFARIDDGKVNYIKFGRLRP
jgi:tRNA-intron endonuclease